jgi:hypothetical protein
MARSVIIVVALVLAGALGFAGTSYWMDRLAPAGDRPPAADTKAPTGVPEEATAALAAASTNTGGTTRCEVEFPGPRCPAHPATAVHPNNRFDDDYENSATSQERCLKRAREYYEWCGFDRPVRARFYRDVEAVGTASFPEKQ